MNLQGGGYQQPYLLPYQQPTSYQDVINIQINQLNTQYPLANRGPGTEYNTKMAFLNKLSDKVKSDDNRKTSFNTLFVEEIRYIALKIVNSCNIGLDTATINDLIAKLDVNNDKDIDSRTKEEKPDYRESELTKISNDLNPTNVKKIAPPNNTLGKFPSLLDNYRNLNQDAFGHKQTEELITTLNKEMGEVKEDIQKYIKDKGPTGKMSGEIEKLITKIDNLKCTINTENTKGNKEIQNHIRAELNNNLDKISSNIKESEDICKNINSLILDIENPNISKEEIGQKLSDIMSQFEELINTIHEYGLDDSIINYAGYVFQLVHRVLRTIIMLPSILLIQLCTDCSNKSIVDKANPFSKASVLDKREKSNILKVDEMKAYIRGVINNDEKFMNIMNKINNDFPNIENDINTINNLAKIETAKKVIKDVYINNLTRLTNLMDYYKGEMEKRIKIMEAISKQLENHRGKIFEVQRLTELQDKAIRIKNEYDKFNNKHKECITSFLDGSLYLNEQLKKIGPEPDNEMESTIKTLQDSFIRKTNDVYRCFFNNECIVDFQQEIRGAPPRVLGKNIRFNYTDMHGGHQQANITEFKRYIINERINDRASNRKNTEMNDICDAINRRSVALVPGGILVLA